MNKAFQTALSYVGLKEDTSKIEHNPEILKFFELIGHKWVKDDETAWCAAFVNACLVMNNYEQTGKLTARSFLNYGEKVEKPTQGDIVVFWRSSRHSWKGHVGFYVSEDENNIYCLGGNQSNMVSVVAYPKGRLLEYRSFTYEVENTKGELIDIMKIKIESQKEQIQLLATALSNISHLTHQIIKETEVWN